MNVSTTIANDPGLSAPPEDMPVVHAPVPMSGAAHHIIYFSPPQGRAGTNAASILAYVKNTAAEVKHVNGSLKLGWRHEIAGVHLNPALFEYEKAMSVIWESIRDAKYLRFVITAGNLENLAKSLPSDWGCKGYPNVCLALATSEGGPPDMDAIDRFGAVRCSWHMLLIDPRHVTADLCAIASKFDWVVVNGPTEDPKQVDDILEACRATGTAFLMLPVRSSGCADGAQDNASALPEHPFGDAVMLRRPTLRGLEHAFHPHLSPSASANTSTNTPETAAMKSTIDNHKPTGNANKEAVTADINSLQPQDDTSPEPGNQVAKPRRRKADSAGLGPRPEAEAVEVELLQDNSPDGRNSDTTSLIPTEMTEDDSAYFKRLDNVVRRASGMFREAGNALQVIRDRQLWRAGNFKSWAEYCEQAAGYTKIHANRLIVAAGIVDEIDKLKPIGFTPASKFLPQNEAQVRPLGALKDPQKIAQAWHTAVNLSGGAEPTAKIVRQAVCDAMAAQDEVPKPAPPKQSRGERRAAVLAKLKEAVGERKSWDHVASLVMELGDLL